MLDSWISEGKGSELAWQMFYVAVNHAQDDLRVWRRQGTLYSRSHPEPDASVKLHFLETTVQSFVCPGRITLDDCKYSVLIFPCLKMLGAWVFDVSSYGAKPGWYLHFSIAVGWIEQLRTEARTSVKSADSQVEDLPLGDIPGTFSPSTASRGYFFSPRWTSPVKSPQWSSLGRGSPLQGFGWFGMPKPMLLPIVWIV